ncbi:MAG: hypothetical protein ACYS1C_10035 [Planctomycetota bacterium]|jgi:hypothetical protein
MAEAFPADIEKHNLAQIELLNQRGGRTLSIVDLIEDGTITSEMAALCWLAIERGACFLTGAVPGGAGKTTLMGALLSFLPPGEMIVTVADRTVLEAASSAAGPASRTLLAHEIGSGRYFGYIWGRNAVDFFALGARGFRTVSCLHADTPQQAAAMLRPLGVAQMIFDGISLQLYVQASAHRGRLRRRVAGLYCSLDGRLRAVYGWRGADDRFEPFVARDELLGWLAGQRPEAEGEAEGRWRRRQALLDGLLREGVCELSEVRRRVLGAFGG